MPESCITVIVLVAIHFRSSDPNREILPRESSREGLTSQRKSPREGQIYVARLSLDVKYCMLYVF